MKKFNTLTQEQKYDLPWVLVEARGISWYQVYDCMFDAVKFVRKAKHFTALKIKGMHHDVSRGSSR